MTVKLRGLVVVVVALAVIGVASGDTPLPSAPKPPPVRMHALTRDITVGADGSTVTVTHTEIQIVTDALLGQMAQQAIGYDASLQELNVDEAYTLKADGRKLAVAPDAILSRGAPQSGSTVVFEDRQQKVIVFPNVEVGDTLAFTTTTRSKPVLPGQFTYDFVVPVPLTIDSLRVTISAPAAIALHAEAKGLDMSHDGNAYTIHYANADPVSDAGNPLSRFDRGPRFSISTFARYEDLVAAYAPLALPKLAVTPKIQQQADAITVGVSDPRERAHRIYDWVSRHIRYVAIEFGAGGIVPHDADTVLTNAYGDCKDHAALFLALLKAKGIEGDLVIINGGNGYSVAAVPTLGAFNHMIAWLPKFRLYADTTSGRTAFGRLPTDEYGKPVVVVAPGSNVLRQIAPRGEDDAAVHLETTATIDDESRLTLATTTTGTGTVAATLRGLATTIANGESAKLAEVLLKARGMPKATGDFTAPPTADLGDSFAIKGTFTTQHRPQMLSGEDFAVPEDFSFVLPTGSLFFGPVADSKLNVDGDVPCYGGRETDDYSLSFPANRHIAKLPDNASVRTANIAFTSHWSSSGNTLTVHRELSAHFDAPVCTAAVRKDLLAAFERVRADYQAKIALVVVAP